MSVKLTEEQFRALELWIFAAATVAAQIHWPGGPEELAHRRAAAKALLVEILDPEDAGRKALQSGETG